MTKISERAKAIVDQVRQGGLVSPDDEVLAGFGEWDRVTPGGTLLMALKLMVTMQRDDHGKSATAIAEELRTEIPMSEKVSIVNALSGDMRAAREGFAHNTITLGRVASLLGSMLDDKKASDPWTLQLLVIAEESVGEVIASGDALRLPPRGQDTGPWDVSERRPDDGDYTDLGGLKIPSGRRYRLDPMRYRGDVVAVTVISGPSAIQLQGFRVENGRSWASVRAELHRTIVASGGEAAEWFGPAGVELRTRLLVKDGSRRLLPSRFFGCDGPGWLLRGIVSGVAADAEGTGGWAYDVFHGVIVDATSGAQVKGSTIKLNWPPSDRI